ncbi:hypothetical protein U1Q18_025878 [Sarracenia purpurea var. burkii]
MEEPSEEYWEIQEYISREESNSKASWILERGLDLGRKMVIAGIVISSVPLVLPPLVVVSALGFVLSVPFGLVFASYACTEKLMSKLLPRGISAPMLENGKVSEDENEQNDIMQVDEGNGRKVDGNHDQESVEEVCQSVKEGGYDAAEYLAMAADYIHKNIEKDVEEPRNDVDGTVKEEVYEEDFREYLGGNDHEGPLEGLDVKIEEMGEVEDPVTAKIMGKQQLEEDQEVHEVVIAVGIESIDKKNGIYLSVDSGTETSRLIEELRDELDVGTPVEKDDGQRKEMGENGGGKDGKNFTHAEEKEKQFEDKSVESDMKEAESERRNEVPKQDKDIQEGRPKENADAGSGEVEQVVEMGGITEGSRDEKNLYNVVVPEKPIGDGKESINGNRFGKVAEITEEQRPVENKKAVMQSGGTKNQSVNAVDDGFQLEREKKCTVDSSADARKTADESGVDLTDNGNGGSDKYLHTVYEKLVEEYDNTSDGTTQKNAGVMELCASVEELELEHAGIASDMDAALPDSEKPLNEKKIREHIEALQTIVGYKASPHATCVEELKALYIFTGVEPPASFKNPNDLVEVNNKLQFLMSIVGVK